LRDLAIFEVGRTYLTPGEGEFFEPRCVAAAMSGIQWASAWGLDRDTLRADFFLCKGVAEHVLSRLGIAGCEFKRFTAPHLHPGRTAVIVRDGTYLGILGEVSAAFRDALDLREPVIVFELDIAALRALATEIHSYKPAPKYPAVSRHLAAVVHRDVEYSAILAAVKRSGELVENVELMDVYSGPQLPEERKSLTLAISFRSALGTLTDEQVTAALDAIKETVRQEVGADFRA
jgi:phenylalanyl-tRNA synthetase beta chain